MEARPRARPETLSGLGLERFAPIEGLHADDCTAAALAYKMLSYALAKGS